VQADRERHERRQPGERGDVDGGPRAGGEAHDDRGEHGHRQHREGQALRGERPVGGEAIVVEPQLVGDRKRGEKSHRI
jgi:hypothetical protein